MTQINDTVAGRFDNPGASTEPEMKSFFAAFLILIPAVAYAAEADDVPQPYLDACAGCHGPQAQGGGEKAVLLSVPVPQLSTFASRNDGVFDKARVIRLIDGREGLSAHGGPMPMFGGLLAGQSVVIDGPDGSPVTTTAPILEIVDWLEAIQDVEP